MLAYRHAFHAGNHADVLKHLVLTQVLRYMALKDKPFTLVDTHAGAGAYSLDSKEARKNAEYVDGIGRLWGRRDLPPALSDYVAQVRRFNEGNGGGSKLQAYPGSPVLAMQLLRADDRLRLYELHSSDVPLLAELVAGRRETGVMQIDGFTALRAELPPPSRRAVVLIDPSYELKTDYGQVLAAVREGLKRFPEAVIMVWYPQLQRLEPRDLVDRLKATALSQGKKGWLHVRLSVAPPDASGFGLMGSGMLVINPPHVLHGMLKQELPVLVEALGRHEGATFLLEKHGG
jgi:23S rRNA (adenine2030-N6)-methyltransferase